MGRSLFGNSERAGFGQVARGDQVFNSPAVGTGLAFGIEFSNAEIHTTIHGSVTALANDASYEEIFSIQLAANMRPGDVVMALSVSGSSPNVVRAVEYANEHGGYTIGCCGFDGGKLAKISKLPIVIPSTKDEYGPVEDMFSVIMHIIQSYISMQRGRRWPRPSTTCRTPRRLWQSSAGVMISMSSTFVHHPIFISNRHYRYLRLASM